MVRHRGSVLVDTNVIIECWRLKMWRALSGGYKVETVEDCITETQTGFQRRYDEEQIDATVLRGSLAAPAHPVTDAQLIRVCERAGDIHLDVGETSLWAHALARDDAWVLCGPDRASLRFAVHAGFRERMTSLESLLVEAGHTPKKAMGISFREKWLRKVLSEMVVQVGRQG